MYAIQKKAEDVIKKLKKLSRQEKIDGIARFGGNPKTTMGVAAPDMRAIAKDVGTNHALAIELRKSYYAESRQVASLIADPKLVDESLMEQWVIDIDSWDVCDATMMHCFRKTSLAWEKAFEWAKREEEFVRRSGFVLMATLAVHAKKEPDERFLEFLPVIEKFSTDNRNFVKKAVNWALRSVGKKNKHLNKKAIEFSERLKSSDNVSTRWIANDALRELKSEKVQARLEVLEQRKKE